ncbi:uncharacterized protein NPIL_288041 [Nephila pilipes]|uniref:Uncharacterized protein n=1 Tax=Nephila pilipes TaxID=299642 RepID=A0A8X6QAA4_NEPPI|nr:uncharacterized protein NPIL_288041 [Nephila pilipes]
MTQKHTQGPHKQLTDFKKDHVEDLREVDMTYCLAYPVTRSFSIRACGVDILHSSAKAELHSILRTQLPDPWDFFRLKQYKEISIILNSASYLIVHLAFLAWFVINVIRRLQMVAGKQLDKKDKCLATIISGVSAMYLLWPFLVSVIHFFTCSFYPWATAVVVLLLYLSFVKNTLNIWYLYIYFVASKHINIFIRFLTNRESLTFVPSSSHGTPFIFDGSQIPHSGDDYIGPSSTPVIQPRLKFEKIDTLTDSLKSEAWHKPPAEYTQLADKEDDPGGIFSKKDRDHPTSKPSPDSPLSWSFNYEEKSDASYGDGEMSKTPKDKYTEHATLPIDQTKSKDITQKSSLKRKKRKSLTPKRNLVKDSKRGHLHSSGGLYGLLHGHKMGYCGRCWRVFNLPFKAGFSTLRKPFTTRLGTPYGPTRYFLTLSQFITDYGIGRPRRTSVR